MTPKPRSHRRLIALVAVLALAAAGCGGGDDDDTTAPESSGSSTTAEVSPQGDPVRGGSITVGIEAETNSWLPGSANFSNAGINVALAIYDPLFRRDADGVLHPYLAEKMAVSDDLTEWTVTLRSGVKFHDGTPLTAQAMKTTFDTYINATGSNLAGQVKDVQSVTAVDELTLLYTLAAPNAAFGDVLAGAVGWAFSPTAAASGPDAGSHPVGTGPFLFGDWQRDSKLVLTRNPDYWQEGLPYLDEIVFRPIPDEDTRISSLKTGDVDAVQSLRQSAIRQLQDLDGVDTYEFLGNNSGSAIFNTSVAPLDDVRVRRALAYALDQDQLIEVLGGTGITPAETQYFSEDSPYYSEAVAAAWPTGDAEEAAKLIDEYVNDPERSDGKAVGDPVTFTFDCPPDPSLIELSQLYQAFWGGIGVEVDLNQVEQATHVSEAIAGDYQAKCWRVGDQGDPYRTFTDAFTADSPLNFTRFSHPRIDEALDVLRTTADNEARKAAVEDISMVLAEEVPNTFTAATLSVLAVQENVKNVDGWTFPDGTKGEGVPGATTMWGHVWLAE
ncbi:MAG TPA: ABC transporter substrate-binding protein [Acidimicrobiales bacterium]|nr:ABC transporter substrate-binding protein [Acidimicrobiales bacterium]